LSTAREIAALVLPHFSEAVLARRQRTYGDYAKLIGLDPATHGIAVGPPMHLIGALCVIKQIPVAPLFYVMRNDKERKTVFAADPIESRYVLPHHELLYVLSREHVYQKAEFNLISKALDKIIRDNWPPTYTPHDIWHKIALTRPKNSENTYLERALGTYQAELEAIRKKRQSSPVAVKISLGDALPKRESAIAGSVQLREILDTGRRKT
jgi:hypothetical protein